MSDLQNSAPASGTVARTVDSFPVIPGYTIRRELGRGGMAVVYLAKDHGLPRDVAVKIIKPEYARDEGFLQRFKDEGNWLAKLESNNTILPIYAIGVANAAPYIVMKYAIGGTLRDKIREEILSVQDKIGIIIKLAKALSFAHNEAEPIAHLDIKPENILFSGGEPLLADFGVAKRIVSLSEAEGAGTRCGDPDYWAPEQAKGKPCIASDVFSLGKTFFELLAGRRPEIEFVQGKKDRKDLTKELEPALRDYAPLIARCLAYKASDRPTADVLAVELEKRRTAPPPSRIPLVVVALIALLVTGWALWQVPVVRETAVAIRHRISPEKTYPIRFSLEPPAGRIWVDGREVPFRALDLKEGKHAVAAVADNYVGQHREITAPVPTGDMNTTFILKPRPPITDEEYFEFTRCGMESAARTAKCGPWVDATLANMALLDRQHSTDADAFKESIKGLRVLAAAGDAVAQTTLFYAAFEDLLLGVPRVELLPGLDMASANGYGLATVLRALHTLDDVRKQDKPMAEITEAKARLLELLDRIEKQGLPQTAGQLRAVLADWEQSPVPGG